MISKPLAASSEGVVSQTNKQATNQLLLCSHSYIFVWLPQNFRPVLDSLKLSCSCVFPISQSGEYFCLCLLSTNTAALLDLPVL